VRLVRLAVVIITCCLITGDTVAAESKWSFKKLIPSFGKKDETPRGLFPETKKPSIWRRMNNGTKTMMAKSKRVVPNWLMPQTQDRVRRSASSLRDSKDRMNGEVRTARRNFFAPWATKSDTEKRPETVPDFLAQPRPE
jgi:hypothetical protein